MRVFGPVPSRRLGRSLGINNIPPKSCCYSCVYCQVGPTRSTEIVQRPFYAPEAIIREVREHLQQAAARGERIDYLTFVPDGEPTLDSRLGEMLDGLRPLGIPLAVISNAALIWKDQVRDTLSRADWVSLKVDAIDASLWRRVNRPDPRLRHQLILDGMLAFARDYAGTLATETMLVSGVNDSETAADELAAFLRKLAPDRAYLAVPTRPPSEPSVRAPGEAVLNRFFQTVSRSIERLELLTGYEGNAFSTTGDAATDLLAITAVHPMREAAVVDLLERAGCGWDVVESLLASGQLKQTDYQGRRFYLRALGG